MPDLTSTNSAFYEKLVEHIFISELLQEALLRHQRTVEVLRAEIDSSGYDLVLECNGKLRHLQLKSSKVDGAAASQNVNVALAEKPHGCVIWVFRSVDESTGRFEFEYRLLEGIDGGKLGRIERLPAAKHTKGDSTGKKKERPNIRRVPKSMFEPPCDISVLVKRLFGL